MADNVQLPKSGGTFIARMKEVASGIFSAIPLIGNPSTGDPLTLGRKAEAATLSFSIDTEAYEKLLNVSNRMDAFFAILAAFGAKATTDAPEPNDGDENLPLSVNIWQALRTVLTDSATGEPIDTSLAAPVYPDVQGEQAPYLAMLNNTNAQPILENGGAGVCHDLLGWKVYNSSGSTVVVQILNGSTVVDEFPIEAGKHEGYPVAACASRGTADTDWNVKMPSAAQAGVKVKAWFRTRLEA